VPAQVATTLIVILEGSVEALAGVYTMAFLSVMAFFAVGTMLLKFKRPDLRRTIICPSWMAMAGLVMVFIAFVGASGGVSLVVLSDLVMGMG
jgi:hypothetical protein